MLRLASALVCLAGAPLLVAAPDPGPPLPPGAMDGGLVVTVGLHDPAVLAELGKSGRRLVNAQVADPRAVQPLREALHARGLAGLVVVHEQRAGQPLPYADNQVDAVICDPAALGTAAPTPAELVRITAPYGLTITRRGDRWERAVKPRPVTMDDWRSFYGGPGQNPLNADKEVAPFSTPRWLSTSGWAIGSGVRIEGPVAVHAAARTDSNWLPTRRANLLQVRSAFSGVPLANLPVRQDPLRILTLSGGSVLYRAEDAGPLLLYRCGDGQTVTLAPELTALTPPADKSVSPELWLRPRLSMSRAVPLDDGGFLVSIDGRVGCFGSDGTLRWSAPDARLYLPSVSDGLIVGVVGTSANGPYTDSVVEAEGLRALRVKDGTVAWDATAARGGVIRRFYGAAEGVLGFSWFDAANAKEWHGRSNNVTLIETATGKVRWEKNNVIKGVTIDTLIAGGNLWLTGVNTARLFALKDGAELQTFRWPQWNCQEARATPGWFLAGTTFIPLGQAGGAAPPAISGKGIARAACNVGNWPANGLVYNTGTNCSCFEQWRGNGAFASGPEPAPEEEKARLERGPAPAGERVPGLPDAGWPTWNRDSTRGAGLAGSVSPQAAMRWRTNLGAPLRTGPLAEEWALTDTVPGRISQAVIAESRAFVALPDEHRVVALDLATGRVLWSYLAGGRVDAPPTVAGGTAFFGCRDGWVYALDAATGALRWRYLAAPARRNLVADGHLESLWPVYAPVVIHDGGLFAAAGRHSALQHGITVVRLDPATGAAVWRRTWHSGDIRNTAEGKSDPDYVESINDVLLVSAGLICLGNQAFDPRTGEHGPIRSGPAASRLANDRDSSARVGDREIRVARINSSRLGMVHGGGPGHVRTYDGIAARILSIDPAGGRIYTLHGGKMRGSGGGKSSNLGDLDAWALDANGFVLPAEGADRRPVSLWRQISPDSKDRRPGRVALIRVGTQLAIAERFGAMPNQPEHAVALHQASDGAVIGRVALPGPPMLNGLSSDGSRLLIALEDGSLACFE